MPPRVSTCSWLLAALTVSGLASCGTDPNGQDGDTTAVDLGDGSSTGETECPLEE